MKTQMMIQQHTRSIPQGSWKYQKRGVTSMVAFPAILGQLPNMNCKCVREFKRYAGALGVTAKSKYSLPVFGRDDEEQVARHFGLELMPIYGGDSGPWLTLTPCPKS